MKKQKMIILSGLPGCGKSTYIEEYIETHKNENVIVKSNDIIREKMILDNPNTDVKNLSRKELRTKMIKELIMLNEYQTGDYTVMYDATNLEKEDRHIIYEVLSPFYTIEIIQILVNPDIASNKTQKRFNEPRYRKMGFNTACKLFHMLERPEEGYDCDTFTIKDNTTEFWKILSDHVAEVRVNLTNAARYLEFEAKNHDGDKANDKDVRDSYVNHYHILTQIPHFLEDGVTKNPEYEAYELEHFDIAMGKHIIANQHHYYNQYSVSTPNILDIVIAMIDVYSAATINKETGNRVDLSLDTFVEEVFHNNNILEFNLDDAAKQTFIDLKIEHFTHEKHSFDTRWMLINENKKDAYDLLFNNGQCDDLAELCTVVKLKLS